MAFRNFIGSARTALDDKGRTAFPKDFRRQLNEGESENLVVTRGPKGSLRLYVHEEFERFMEKVDSTMDEFEAERFRYELCMTFVSLDGQNRILLPKNLLEKAKLDGEVLWVPSRGKALALWNPKVFDEIFKPDSAEASENFDAMFYGKKSSGASGANT